MSSKTGYPPRDATAFANRWIRPFNGDETGELNFKHYRHLEVHPDRSAIEMFGFAGVA